MGRVDAQCTDVVLDLNREEEVHGVCAREQRNVAMLGRDSISMRKGL